MVEARIVEVKNNLDWVFKNTQEIHEHNEKMHTEIRALVPQMVQSADCREAAVDRINEVKEEVLKN